MNNAAPAQAIPAKDEVFFINTGLQDLSTLLNGLPEGADVVLLDESKDGLHQMAEYLEGRQGLTAIHLLSHGTQGAVQVGSTWLSSANLAEHQAALQSIGAALGEGGDLLLYGCDVGQGGKGKSFLDQLAAITGADVAASADDTGAAALGGNWTLERSSGAIETSALSVDGYDNLMAVVYTGGQVATAPILGNTAANLMRMVVGDFNNDGRDDILYQDNTNLWRFAAGQADGTFITVLADQPGSPFAGLSLGASASNGVNYHAADFDGDGDTDLLSAAVSAQQLTLYLHNNGVFSAAAIPGGPQFGNRTIVGDFDGDGAADLLYQTTSTSNAPWRVMMNTGDGTMTDLDITDTASPFRNINLPDFILYQYRIADVDGDGDVDLIHLVAGSSMSYFRNDNGTFVDGTLVGIASPLPQTRYMVADFDGDGDADILFQLSATTNDWKFYRNDGTNGSGNPIYTLLEKEDADSPIKGLSMVNMSNQNYRFGDFDGDGDLDLFASSLNVAGSVYLQSGSSPKLLSATPGDDTLNVAPAANIVLTFDQAVSKGTGNIYIVRAIDKVIVQTIAVGSSSVSGSGSTWTIDPPADMVAGFAYAVRIDAKTFVNADGKIYKGITNNSTLNFTTSTVQPPVINNLNGDSVSFIEDSALVLLDAGGNAMVTDLGSANFNGGKLTIQIISGGTSAEDLLLIRDQGLGANQVSVSGASVTYNGLVIGTLTGGSNGDSLVLSLTNNATPATVSAVLQNLAYRNSNTVDPSTTSRNISISLEDGAGGTSATSTVAVSVMAVNDAPLVNVTATHPTYTENSSAVQLFNGATINTVESGQKVTQMTFTVTTVYNGAAEKLVIDGSDVTLTNGTSVVTTNNSTVVTISVASGTASVTLNSSSGLDSATAQTILNTMAYRNDSESPNASTRMVTLSSVSDNGGSANGGLPIAAIGIFSTVTMVGINDAPVLSGGPYSLPSINEDTTSTGVWVSTLLTNYTMMDDDIGAFRGIAVYGKSGNGTWQYSTDSANWTDFGAVSSTSALLLASTTYLRYVPDGANGETASLNFRGWDQSTGTASVNGVPGVSDTTSNGGTTAFSAGTAVANQVVTSVNDAPVLTGVSPALNGITDTAINNGGSTVLSLLGGVTDIDNSAVKGMAITGLTATYGKWQYSLDAGLTWGDVGMVSTSSALMLAAQNLVRFVPDSLHGETATITYKAWDQSSNAGLQGGKVNVTTSGGTSAYSTSTDTASVVVTAVNDAPVATVPASLTVTEDVPGGVTGISFSDVDAGSGSVTVTFSVPSGTLSAVSGSGVTVGDSGTAMLTLSGTLSDINAFIADSSVKYQTALDNTSSVLLTVSINDNGNTGGTAQTDTKTVILNVTAVNDAPVNSVPGSQTVGQGNPLVFNSLKGNLISVSDVDIGSALIQVTLTATHGTLTLSSATGLSFTFGDSSADATMTFSGTLSAVNSALNGLIFTPATGYSGPATITLTTNDSGGTGSGGALSDTDVIAITVSPPPEPEPVKPTEPTKPEVPVLVDGALVSTQTAANGSTITTITPVTADRTDDPNTPNAGLADIPLIIAPNGQPIVQVGLPVGVGLQSQGQAHALNGGAALTELALRIQAASGNAQLLSNGQSFMEGVDAFTPLHVQTITVSTGTGFNPAVALVISGSGLPQDGKQAIVLDARALPSGSVIQVDNIDFIAVVGNVRLIGGSGQNMASGDDAAQYIVLGADDDIIHGGGGNDTVGSKGGNDQVYGDAGDDIVFGGAGNDLLSGGSGSDRLNGGTGFDVAIQEGKRSDYTVTLDGTGIKLTHVASGVSDWLVDMEQVRFATGPSLTVAHSAAEEAAAFLFQQWMGRDLTQSEGALIQTLAGQTALQVAELFAQVFPQQAGDRTAQQLLDGMEAAGAIRVDAQRETAYVGDAGDNSFTPTPGLAWSVDGGAGIDTIVFPASFAQLHIEASDTGFTLQRMTDGAMLELSNVERLTLSDTQIAFDLDGHAGEAAKLLGALGGMGLLDNRPLVGEVIRALDAGVSAQSLAQLGLQVLGAKTSIEVTQLIWTNVVGSAATPAQLQPFVDLMAQGVTGGELAVLASNLDLNATRIDLVGLAATGIEFA